MPSFDVRSRHVIRIAASPARVYRVARHLDLGSPLPVRILMALRAGPAWLAGRLRGSTLGAAGPAAGREVGAVPFVLLAERPEEEFVLAIMGRFWTPTGGVVAADAERFRVPPPAGMAQGFWNFRVTAAGAATELSTETRVRCADEASRRKFERYWRFIRIGSGLIRGSMLRRIRTLSEREDR